MNTEKIRTTSLERLKKIGLTRQVPLPLLEEQFSFKSMEEAAIRVDILHTFYAIYLSGRQSLDFFRGVLEECGDDRYLTGKEKSLLATGNITDQDLIDFSWCKESAKMLLWVGSITDEDVLSSFEECDFSVYYSLIPPERSFADYMESFRFVEENKVIQHLDFYYCLHWYCRRYDERVQNPKVAINTSVVVERRKALEWVTHSYYEWDNFSLDT